MVMEVVVGNDSTGFLVSSKPGSHLKTGSALILRGESACLRPGLELKDINTTLRSLLRRSAGFGP